ncbi:hypothetical protein MIND_00310200 [Mycena indigotica]|uniref:Integral membrane protein n=1 Tax=Mycena indigotica TaxID=2126181 RepID=A0A8H6T1X0_9AGAR|nr:uncharacterized protein MIND_00310200 [Mycena indigotica]KAF7309394.1 hypothetical protein MIND_00310200 [Mycena indigotica]
MADVPQWPSLYNPGIELLNIPHHDPVQPLGKYLTRPGDIFRFTLYWTLIFYIPTFLLCALYAFVNLTFPPTHRKHGRKEALDGTHLGPTTYPLSPISPRPPYFSSPRASAMPNAHILPATPTSPMTNRKHPSNSSSVHTPLLRPNPTLPARPNRVRSRTTFALLVLLAFLTLSLTGAVLSSAIVGFGVAGVYRASGFVVSTWVPFVWALISALVGFLSIWPSVIDII